jgi:hypothetical protein
MVHKSNSFGRQASKSAVTRIDVPGTPIHSQQRPHHFLKADKAFLSIVSDNSTAPATTLLVRRHFADVTARLLAPINRYLVTSNTASSSPTATEKGQAGPSTFSFSEFQQTVAQYSTQVPFSGQTSHGRHKSRGEFYSKFCQSPNFHAWLEMRNVTEREAAAGMMTSRGDG